MQRLFLLSTHFFCACIFPFCRLLSASVFHFFFCQIPDCNFNTVITAAFLPQKTAISRNTNTCFMTLSLLALIFVPARGRQGGKLTILNKPGRSPKEKILKTGFNSLFAS